jgi:hypothetical protein
METRELPAVIDLGHHVYSDGLPCPNELFKR